jgi:hypothetical protein
MIQKQLEVGQWIAAGQRMVQRATSPMCKKVGIGAVIEKPRHSIVIVPVELANQHGRDTDWRELAALNQNLQSAIVERFGRMIHHLTVIRVGSTLQQQSGHFRVVSNTGSAVQHALPLRFGLVAIFEESAVGAGSGIEQRRGRAHKAVRPRAVETQIFREAEMGQRFPPARASLCGGVRRIAFCLLQRTRLGPMDSHTCGMPYAPGFDGEPR